MTHTKNDKRKKNPPAQPMHPDLRTLGALI